MDELAGMKFAGEDSGAFEKQGNKQPCDCPNIWLKAGGQNPNGLEGPRQGFVFAISVWNGRRFEQMLRWRCTTPLGSSCRSGGVDDLDYVVRRDFAGREVRAGAMRRSRQGGVVDDEFRLGFFSDAFNKVLRNR